MDMAKTKAQYNTHQREELLKYLKENPGKHLTAADICTHLNKQGAKIGTTTVYRQLEKLVNDGTLTKYIIEPNTSACFEYTDQEKCVEDAFVFHCKCEKCGALFHVQCEELDGIGAHLREHHHFALNPKRTVFYGTCEECMSKEN